VIAHAAIGPAGFVVGSGASAWYAPTGSQVLNNAATPAAMADDSISQALALPFSFPSLAAARLSCTQPPTAT
jgi:hypothetical protein